MTPEQSSRLRLAELMASLSFGIDMGVGQPMEWVLRSCLLGVYLSQALGMSDQERQDVYYLTLLRYVGCTSTAASDAALFGDELGVAELMTLDPDDMTTMMRAMFRLVGQGKSVVQRAQLLARLMASGTSLAETIHVAHCEVAGKLSESLSFDLHIQKALWQFYERWDGRGVPNHLHGEDIVLPVRVVQLAQDAATFYTLGGVELAIEVVRQRAGRLYDPQITEVFCQNAAALLSQLEVESTWDAVLAAEPGSPLWLKGEQYDTALQAVADFADLKSPYTLGHSRAVAELVEVAARKARLPSDDAALLRSAAHVHDLGRVGVSAGIWGKGGALSESEWERVRLHPYYTERILARSSQLARLGALAAAHHERLDGSGYFRGLKAAGLSPLARLLAAANAYSALLEPRPHRAQHSPEQAADALRREVHAGRLDEKMTDAVLDAAGHRIPFSRRAPATDLSERELEVLRLLARGLSNRQMAGQLSISQKTVGHHIQHIYNKIGVATRAGATLFAVQNNLLTDED